MLLRRTYSSFPSGGTAAALLLLRATVGLSALAESLHGLTSAHSLWGLVSSSLAALSGLSLLPGFLTHVVSALLAGVAMALLLAAPHASLWLFDSRLALIEFAVMAAATATIGPGSISVDARLYGRREVIIGEQHPRDTE